MWPMGRLAGPQGPTLALPSPHMLRARPRHLASLIALALASASACTREPPTPTETEQTARERPAAAPQPAPACQGAEREGGKLRWFVDDYDKARACAGEKGVPLVIDMWAPWCHTCLSMKATVFLDDRLAEHDRRFVFLALDTDREVNAAAVKKFPPAAWPTFFVVAPADESILARFVGAATIDQLIAFLTDGERAFRATATDPLAPHEAAARDGDRLASAGDHLGADAAYTAALAAAPADWVRRSDLLGALISAKARRGAHAECAATALERDGELARAASQTDFFGVALGCAEALAQAEATAPQAAAVRERALLRLSALIDDQAAPLSVDDRSDALMYLRTTLDQLGRADEARAAAERQRALLDAAAAAAPTPMAAMTYNWPRAEVYTYLKIGGELVADLERSAAALPREYDPPHRLAWTLLKADRPREALPWIAKAEALAYGPRKARVLALAADIHEALGDREEARRCVLRQIDALQNSASPSPANDAAIQRAQDRAAALGGPA
jgi:thioredoxin-like negative regulator of GroEL